MKNVFTAIIFILMASTVKSQDITAIFEHDALVVEDVDIAAEFYREILGLEPIPVPGGNEERRWFSMGNGLQLHLIKGDRSTVVTHKSIHMAFRIRDIQPFVELLTSKSVTYYSWPGEKNVITTRADGIHQVYIRDPDGYWIEINDMLSEK